MAIAKYNRQTHSDSLDNSDVPYRTALPNSCDGSAMAGNDSQGPNGPDRPVCAWEDRMMSRRDACLGVMCDGARPVYRGGGGGCRRTSYLLLVGAGLRRRQQQQRTAPPPPACGQGCWEGSPSTSAMDDMALRQDDEKEDHNPLFIVRHQDRIGTTVCRTHGNNFYGYRGQVLNIWYLKPTKVHIVISI
jgi:hypothetical protein